MGWIAKLVCPSALTHNLWGREGAYEHARVGVGFPRLHLRDVVALLLQPRVALTQIPLERRLAVLEAPDVLAVPPRLQFFRLVSFLCGLSVRRRSPREVKRLL